MRLINRILDINLPKRQSAFLWGARKTGKTTYLKMKFPSSIVYDFLKTDLFFEVAKRPYLLREWLLAKPAHLLKQPIILDEVQKVPEVLNEVHWLIENKQLQFILCGSSARKLKRRSTNLLGGRAWHYRMVPFVSIELKDKFNLLKALNRGMIPSHYLGENYRMSLKAYVEDYLKEEILAEGLARNIPAFSRFLETFAYSHGEITNYSNIARDCGVDAKTVKEYFQILIDTLLAVRVEPFRKKRSRQIITKASKYYLFDVGVAGFLRKRHLEEERGEEFGRAFEHFILMEIYAYRSYKMKDFEINFWRTKSGLEVDFLLDRGRIAVEVKGAERLDRNSFKGILAFREEHSPQRSIVVCREKERRIYKNIEVIPYKEFLKELWSERVV